MPATSPNLLFVFADQLRARELEDPAHPLLSPAWDRLTREGLRCTNMTANCPVCTPSRAMLLTGQYPLTNRVVANDLPLPEDAVTLGDLLADAGYRTGYIGKWHLDGVPRSRFTPPGPRRHGFQYWAVHNCIHAYQHSAYYTDSPEPRPVPGYEPAFQTDLSLEFLAQPDPRPWSLFLSWGPPHDPYPQVPAEYEQLYDPATLAYPPSFLQGGPELDPPGGRLVSPALPWDPRRSVAQYYAAITALDAQLARLLDALEASGQADNTLVVYTSDHGDMLWSHNRMFKQQPWDEAVRVPLALRWPGHVPAGTQNDGCISVADLAPTLLGLLGLGVPATMQGADLSQPLQGQGGGMPDSALLLEPVSVDQSYDMGVPEWRAVRTRRHTFVRTRSAPWLLYDHQADPDQLTNLLGRPEMALIQAELEALLADWLARTGDDFDGSDTLLAKLNLETLWNSRERELHPHAPRLLA